MKLIDARKDHYRRLAHEQGYRSRSSYKLKEINKSYRLFGPGFSVLDLGCAPGGWLQVAKQVVGNTGQVLGIDTSYVEDISGVEIMRGDIEDESISKRVSSYFNHKVQSVICDLSPQVSGNWSVDHAKQISLNYAAAKIMENVLSTKGNALFKVFDGEYSDEFYNFIRKKFSKTKLTKPKASRKPSSELYCICLGFINQKTA